MAGMLSDKSEFDLEIEALDLPEEEEYKPIYKVISDNKIPISKKEGALWKQRIDLVKQKRQPLVEIWDETTDMYVGKKNADNNGDKRRNKINEKYTTYENLLWSNTNGISRETIMKKPKLEFTGNNEQSNVYSPILAKGINKYMGLTGNTGINIEEKLKKVDILAQLTNRGIIRMDWNDKIDVDAVNAQIKKCGEELALCKTEDEIKEVEGKLYALNEKLEGSGLSGAQFTIIDPRNLYIDPNSQLESGLDADWMVEERIELEDVINAKYKNEDVSIYSGKEDTSDSGEDEETYYLTGEEDECKLRSKLVKTYYVWDKIKKRTMLFEDGKWDYPIWVWEDELGLEQYFPYFILNYNINPCDSLSVPEVSYYLPLQNEVNKINSQINKARDRAFNVSIYNKNSGLQKKDLDSIATAVEGWVGLDLQQGNELKNAIMPMITPGIYDQAITQKSDLYAMIGRLSSADAMTRGEEYRTNTTNMAIQQYGTAKKTIIGIRINTITNFFKRIAIETLRLMLRKFDMQDWAKLIGVKEAQFITQNPVEWEYLDITVSADDTLEPTSSVKKQEAMQLMQLLGQFAGATPMVSIIMLKILSKAFDDGNMTKDEWDMLFQSLTQQMRNPQLEAQMQGQGQPQQQQQGMPDLVSAAAAM